VPSALLSTPGTDSRSSGQPQKRAEFRLHWRALVAAIVGLCLGFPGLSNYGFGVFIAPLKSAFGWSVSDISSWIFFLMLGTGLTSRLVGGVLDKRGARAVIVVAIPLFAAALASGSLMSGKLWQFHVVAFLTGAIGSALSILTYGKAINERFSAARGTAIGLMVGGIAISSVLAPPIMQRICDAYGWRAGFLFMGAATLLALPFAYFWLKGAPTGAERKVELQHFGFKGTEALRSPAFWTIGSIAFVVGLYSAGVIFNLMPLLTEAGLSRPEAASYLGLFGLFMFVGKITCGLSLDRLPVAMIGAAILLAQAAALVLLGLHPQQYAALAIAVTGFGTGGEIACSTYTVPRYVGMRAFGRSYGIVSICSSAGVATGPYFFSVLRELGKDYHVSLSVAGALAVLAASLYGSLSRYRMWSDHESRPVAVAAP
jgi:predicted MFS family arabinose efflux permease